jgi:hypothetical protein
MAFGEGSEGKEPEIVPAPASPLAERLRDFRDGVGDQPPEDKPAPGERTEEEAETTADDENVEGTEPVDAEEEKAEGEGEEEQGEGEDEPEPDAEAAKAAAGRELEFDIDIPTLNADGAKGPSGSGVLRLEGLPQEYRDTIQSHVERSLQLDVVQQRLEQARELETVARFYQGDPLNAMRLVSVEKPELAAQFVQQWALQNPKATKALIRTLKLDAVDEGTLELQGKLAARDMRDALAEAYTAVDENTTKVAFIDLSKEVVSELVYTLALDEKRQARFEQLAGADIVDEMQRRISARQSPYINKTELATLLQPLIKEFTGASPAQRGHAKDAPAAGKEKLTREQQAQRAQRAQRFRQVRGGERGDGVRPKGLQKGKLPRDLGERIKLLRAGKL